LNRAEKQEQIDQISGTLSSATGVYLVNLSGLTVPQVTDLRRRIKATKGACRVVKNRLAIRGAKGTAAEALAPHFRGPIGIVTHPSEPVSLAKILNDFAKDHPGFSLGAAVVSGQPMTAEDVKTLARLPGLNELRSMMLGLFLAPASRLVRVLAAPGQQLARVLEQRRKQLGGDS
jgi:large subunit ribosomal protein L10